MDPTASALHFDPDLDAVAEAIHHVHEPVDREAVQPHFADAMPPSWTCASLIT